MNKQPRLLTIEQQWELAKLQDKLADGEISFLQYHLLLYGIYEPESVNY